MQNSPAGTGVGTRDGAEGPEADARDAPALGGRRARRAPVFRLLLYYVVLAAIVGTLAYYVPLIEQALLSPIEVPAVAEGAALVTGEIPPTRAIGAAGTFDHTLVRTLTTLLVLVGALLLSLPVAWVYMQTKGLRYDASLVQSVIILPVVVAGILIVVKHSLAIAFALAGIVAAVRFRNTLKDPKDAVYIFLALGLGIAAGVQALDIAMVLSLTFNLIVIALWAFNVGAIYSREYGPRGILSVGDRRLLVAKSPEARRELRERIASAADGMKMDGILLVHTAHPEPARHAVEVSLSGAAKEWKLADTTPGPGGLAVLEFLLKLKKKSTVVDLLGELDDRWGSHVAAAEFVPFQTPKNDDESSS